MSLLAVSGLSVRRRTGPVLEAVAMEVGAGELVGLLGPNGAGKTTLMRAALGLQPAAGGTIRLGGRDLAVMPRRDIAREAAYLPQERSIAWDVTVEVLVGLGRLPRRAGEDADRAAVEAALATMDLARLRHRLATRLSGGERARVLIARALAQEAPLILADEPVAGLDPAHALGLMATFRALAACGHGVLVSLHDLGLAARSCDRVVLLDRGRVAADGPPQAVLTPKRLADVYGVTAHFGSDAGGPILQPVGLAAP